MLHTKSGNSYGVFFFQMNNYFSLRSWSVREARLAIEDRERKGLPHIDKNYIDPSKIVLPTEEELAEMDVEIKW